jgi:RNA-splicing ligase RtcB
MPDTHAGKGAVIGFTMEMGNRVIPNVIGVDIGCGMLSANMGKNLLSGVRKDQLDRAMRKVVPVGTNRRKTVSQEFDVNLFYHRVNVALSNLRKEYGKRFGMIMPVISFNEYEMKGLCDMIGTNYDMVMHSVGTLGGGNHFIEVGKSDATGDYWITIHSGSRNFGKCIAEYHQKVAVRTQNTPIVSKDAWVQSVKDNYPKDEWGVQIARYNEVCGKPQSPRGMEYLEGNDMYMYLAHMIVAQTYADFNRKVMIDEISHVIDDFGIDFNDFGEEIITVHNFIDFDDWVIRKGAIRSYVGEKMVIPWNAEDGLTLCTGKSNPEWNYSAPHGAGRLFSRSDAKRKLDHEAAKESMKAKGIYSSGIPHDEIKGAYKDPEIIERCIEPTADIYDRVKPVLNIKG